MPGKRKREEAKLPEFKYSRFFGLAEDKKFIKDERYPVYFDPEKAGGELIAEYYAWKYLANITLTNQKNLATAIRKAIENGKEMSEYRETILIDFAKTHCVAITYLKQGDNQGLFVYDSTKEGHKHLLKPLLPLELDIFSVEETSQFDRYSCHVHGMVVGRDATRLDRTSGRYYIPDLLTFLKSHSDQMIKGFYAINKLPQSLLSDTQMTSFVEKFSLQDEDNKAFTEFRKKYSDTVKTRFSGEKNISTYLLKKGLKFSNIIQIQFYLKEFRNLVPEDILTLEAQKDFVKQAKKLLAESKPSKSTEVVQLQEFAQKFIDDLIAKNKKMSL
jgi:hypothetical protein